MSKISLDMNNIFCSSDGIDILFLCSGDCYVEIEYMKYLIDQNINIKNVVFIDLIYSDESKVTEIMNNISKELDLVKTKIIFSENFSDIKNIVKFVKIDNIISFGFQIILNHDINNMSNKCYYNEHVKLYDTFEELGKLFHDTRWLYFMKDNNDKYDFNNPELKSGLLFNDICEKKLKKIPRIFMDKKITLSNY